VALAAVGSAVINAAINGPLRSAATDTTTTIDAVIVTFSASPYQKNGSASMLYSSLPGFDPAIHPLRLKRLCYDGCPGPARA